MIQKPILLKKSKKNVCFYSRKVAQSTHHFLIRFTQINAEIFKFQVGLRRCLAKSKEFSPKKTYKLRLHCLNLSITLRSSQGILLSVPL